MENYLIEITILLSIVMFSLLISGIIPASSTALPTIVMYFTTVMCMCSMSVVATVIVLDLHHKTAKNHTMPMWVSNQSLLRELSSDTCRLDSYLYKPIFGLVITYETSWT